MADRVISAEARITAKDATGQAFAAIASKMQGLANKAKGLAGKTGGLAGMAKQIEAVEAAAGRLSKVRPIDGAFLAKVRAEVTAAGSAFRRAEADVKAMANAMRRIEPTGDQFKGLRAAQENVRGLAAAYAASKEAATAAAAAYRLNASVARDAAVAANRTRSSVPSAGQRMGPAGPANGPWGPWGGAPVTPIVPVGQSRARQVVGALAGPAMIYAGHKVAEERRKVGETYREFDDTARYQRAILEMTPQQQAPFIDQAIHMGATTPYNDLQVLHAQTDLAQRGVKRDFIRPFVGEVANYASAMGTTLPDAAKTLEGIIFSTGKHVEDAATATAVMRRSVDQAVKLAKIGGLDNEDIKAFFKYGGQPGSSAGLSDESMGALAALMRRSNIRGDEAGVAVRAIASKLWSPTSKALAAYDAMGIDYSKFVRTKESAATPDSLQSGFKRTFGKGFSDATRAKVAEAVAQTYTDANGNELPVTADAGAFATALTDAVSDEFAKSKKGKLKAADATKIAKWATDFYKAARESVDTEGLLRAIMEAKPTLGQSNALFTSQQGGRALAALKDAGLFNEYFEKLKNAPQGYAQTIAETRQGGYAGARSRLEGAKYNVDTALGRALDQGDPIVKGEGGWHGRTLEYTPGPLTQVYDAAARAAQSLAELPRPIQQVIAVGGLATELAGKLGGALQTASALLEFRAATALTNSAHAIDAAAARLGGAPGGPGVGAASNPGGASSGPGWWATILGSWAVPAAVAAGGAYLSQIARDSLAAQPTLRKSLLASPMLGAMAPDYALASGIMDARQGQANQHLRRPHVRRERAPIYEPMAVDPMGGVTGASPTVAPKGDASGIAPVTSAAEAAERALKAAADVTVAPKGDASAIAALGSAVDALLAKIRQVGSEAASVASRVRRMTNGPGSNGTSSPDAE